MKLNTYIVLLPVFHRSRIPASAQSIHLVKLHGIASGYLVLQSKNMYQWYQSTARGNCLSIVPSVEGTACVRRVTYHDKTTNERAARMSEFKCNER